MLRLEILPVVMCTLYLDGFCIAGYWWSQTEALIEQEARSNDKRELRKELFKRQEEQVLSFALDIADRVLVIENGEIVRDDPRAGIDEAQIAKFLSV